MIFKVKIWRSPSLYLMSCALVMISQWENIELQVLKLIQIQTTFPIEYHELEATTMTEYTWAWDWVLLLPCQSDQSGEWSERGWQPRSVVLQTTGQFAVNKQPVHREVPRACVTALSSSVTGSVVISRDKTQLRHSNMNLLLVIMNSWM